MGVCDNSVGARVNSVGARQYCIVPHVYSMRVVGAWVHVATTSGAPGYRVADRIAKGLATKCLSANKITAVEKAKDNFLLMVELELGEVVLVGCLAGLP